MNPCGRNQFLRNNRFRGQAGFPACRAGREDIPCSCKRSLGDGEKPDPHHHDWRLPLGGRTHVHLPQVDDHSVQSELPPSGDHEIVYFPAPRKHEPGPERHRIEGDVSQRGHNSRWARPARRSAVEVEITGRTRPNISRRFGTRTPSRPRLARAAPRAPLRLLGCDLARDLSNNFTKSLLSRRYHRRRQLQ